MLVIQTTSTCTCNLCFTRTQFSSSSHHLTVSSVYFLFLPQDPTLKRETLMEKCFAFNPTISLLSNSLSSALLHCVLDGARRSGKLVYSALLQHASLSSAPRSFPFRFLLRALRNPCPLSLLCWTGRVSLAVAPATGPNTCLSLRLLAATSLGKLLLIVIGVSLCRTIATGRFESENHRAIVRKDSSLSEAALVLDLMPVLVTFSRWEM